MRKLLADSRGFPLPFLNSFQPWVRPCRQAGGRGETDACALEGRQATRCHPRQLPAVPSSRLYACYLLSLHQEKKAASARGSAQSLGVSFHPRLRRLACPGSRHCSFVLGTPPLSQTKHFNWGSLRGREREIAIQGKAKKEEHRQERAPLKGTPLACCGATERSCGIGRGSLLRSVLVSWDVSVRGIR